MISNAREALLCLVHCWASFLQSWRPSRALVLSVLFWLNMTVLDYMVLVVDQYVSLAFLAFVGHVDAADVECSAVGNSESLVYHCKQ